MTEETFLQRAKRERDEADTKLIQTLLETVPEKVHEAVMQRKESLRLSVEKIITEILRTSNAPATKLFYAEMAKIGFERHAIKLEIHSERPPYSYDIILRLED